MSHKHTLTLAIAAVIASTSVQAGFSSFYEDATVSGKLRTVYIDADRKDGKDDVGAWTASAMIDFKSGWINDAIGFDASFYGIQKLDSAEYYSDKYDYYDAKNLLDDSGNDFSKISQAYLKGKFGTKDAGASFKAGRTRIYTGLISGSGSRSIPSAWQGIDTDFNYKGLNVGVAWVNAVLPRDRAGMKRLETAEGKRIDYITGMEATYKFHNGLKLKYTNAYSKDYIKSHQIVAKHNYKLASGDKLTVEGNYRISEDNGGLWTGTGGWGGNGFDDKAQTYDFNVKYGFGNAYVRAGLGYTEADTYQKGGDGDYKTARHYYDFGKYSYGSWNTWTNSGLIEEFYWDGEKVFALGAGYNFADIMPGLTIDYKYRVGSSIDVVNRTTGKVDGSASESEHGIDMKYKFQNVKGLSTRVRYAIYQSEDVPRETDEKQLRVYLDYKF